MTGCHVFRKESYQPRSIVLMAVVLALGGGPLFAADANTPSGVTRNKVIPLANIPAERGREFLSRLKIGTVSRLPGTNALLVTAEPGELQKAIAILDLVDTRTEFDIKELGFASAIPCPSNAQIASAVGGVSIGTFANPPQDKAKMRAIVDVHEGMIVVVAPVFQLQDIRLAVELGPEVLKQRKAAAKPGKEVSGGRVGQAPSHSSFQTIQATTPADPLLEPVSNGTWEAGSGRLTHGSPARDLSVLEVKPRISTFNLQASNNEQSEKLAPSQETQQKQQEMPPKTQTAEPPQSAKESPKPEDRVVGAGPESDLSDLGARAQPQPAAQGRQGEAAPASSRPSGSSDKLNEPAAEDVSSSKSPVSSEPPAPMSGPSSKPPTSDSSPPQPLTTPVAASSAVPQAEVRASAYRPAEAANGDEVLDLTLQEKMSVILLLDLVGKHLGLSYVYNPDEVKGDVSLKLNGDLHGFIRVKDLYPLLEQTLRANNLVTTRHRGNVVTIVPAARALEIDPVLIDPSVSRVEVGDTVVTSKFELKHIDTSAAKNLLENMRLGLDVTAIAEKHMLIVTTYAYRMERIVRLLQMVDQPGEPKKFGFRQLRYTMAKTLVDKVKAMAEQMLESVSVTVAESEPGINVARTPGESDIAYRTRVAQIRAQQTALRAQQAVVRAQLGQEPKPGVYLDADERTNRVLMIGAEKQLAVVEQLVNALDVEQQDLRALQLYRMQHVDAEEMARKLQELGIISRLPENPASTRYGTGTTRITPQLPGQPRPAVPTAQEVQVPPTTEVTEKGLVEEPQVVVVEATNSLLVNATAEQHAKIAHIIEYVDSETLTNEIPYKLYPLKSSSPKHMAEVLQSLIQETVEQQKEGGKIEKVVVNKDEKIKIVPDPNTCSLIVYANKKNQEWIANLIEQLDKRRPQVLIDVTLVEITKSDVFNYDLDLVRGSPDLASTSAISNVKPGADSIGKVVQTGGSGLSAFYGDQQIQALLQTMQSKSYGRVLAKPRLLVNDNEKGKIETTDTTYVEVTSAIPVNSGAAGTQTNLVQTSVNFNPYKAGITLNITPHISEGELLRLDIVMTRSDFLKTTATKPPDTRENQVDTKATLPNGSTVILGGMLKMNQVKGGSKVPLLGDIPLLGGLFRTINNEDTQSKLYVFVKAEIIRPAEIAGNMKDLETLSDRNRQAFEKHELEFQKYEDWPGIKSKRVEPSKVLDAQ
jgi:general secretion pathway protein D